VEGDVEDQEGEVAGVGSEVDEGEVIVEEVVDAVSRRYQGAVKKIWLSWTVKLVKDGSLWDNLHQEFFRIKVMRLMHPSSGSIICYTTCNCAHGRDTIFRLAVPNPLFSSY